MDVGRELAEARQRLQLTHDQVAATTKIQAAKIEALERNDYEHLPSGIYLDGIIRVYAQEVGLDPEPLVEQARMLTAALPAAAAQNSTPSTRLLTDVEGPRSIAEDPSPVAAGVTTFAAQPDLLETAPELDVLHTEPELTIAGQRGSALPPPSPPFVVPAREASASQPSRAMQWALPVVALLAAIGWGLYFYSVREPFPQRTVDAAVTDSGVRGDEPAGATGAAGAADATAANESRERAAENERPAQKTERTRLPDDRVTADRAAGRSAADAGREAARGPVAPSAAATGNSAARATGASARERDAQNAAGVKVAGSWDLATNVESASYKAYHGMRLGYRVRLEQEGNRITGTGQKWTENGRELGPQARTPIKLEGTTDGQRLTLNFTEQGARRASNGKLILHVTEDGLLRGRFSSTAARSSGTAEARPLP
jgi:cytoskeletal protein RodZ